MDLESIHKKIDFLLQNSELWKKPSGAGGQDQYAGLPPAIRLLDEIKALIPEKGMSTIEVKDYLNKHHQHPLAWICDEHVMYSEAIYYKEEHILNLLKVLGHEVNFEY